MASLISTADPFSVEDITDPIDNALGVPGGPVNIPNSPNADVGRTVAQPSSTPDSASATTMILSARGAFYQVSLAENAAGASKGFYDVEFLTYDTEQKSPQSPILINGVQFKDSDIVGRMPCLNNYKVYYSFGQNFGDISISGEVLLGPLGGIKTDGVNRLRDFFAMYRVSVYNKPIVVHIVDKAYLMYLEGLQILPIDREFHILPFMLFGTMLDISRTASGLLNPSSVVLSDVNLDNGSLAAALSVINPQVASQTTSASGSTVSATPAASSSTVASTTAANQAVSNPPTTGPGANPGNYNNPPANTLSSSPPPGPLAGPVTDPIAAYTQDDIAGTPTGQEAQYTDISTKVQQDQLNLDALNAPNVMGPTSSTPQGQAQITDAQNQLAADQAQQAILGNAVVNDYNTRNPPPLAPETPTNYEAFGGTANPASSVPAAKGPIE